MTEGQKAYLASLTPQRAGQIVYIKPYDSRIPDIATEVILKIRYVLSNADIRFMGASALGISGQNDIDLYVITPDNRRREYIARLTELFGIMKRKNKWTWLQDEIEVSVRIYDSNGQKEKEHFRLFTLFTNNPSLVKEYEALKQSMNGKTYLDYQVAKYEFYNWILVTK